MMYVCCILSRPGPSAHVHVPTLGQPLTMLAEPHAGSFEGGQLPLRARDWVQG